MKLDNPVTLVQPPYTDHNNKVVTPEPFTLEVLDITYSDNPTNRSVTAVVKGVPYPIYLLYGDDYTAAGDYTQAFIEQKLRDYLGSNPQSEIGRAHV